MACALGVAELALWIHGLPEGAGAPFFAWLSLAVVALQIGAVVVLWRQDGRLVLVLVAGFAVAFRLAAWFWPPDLSSDLHRYVWDGRVQLAGRSPYLASPDDPALAGLRDSVEWPQINRKEVVTVYPPGGQVLFLGLALVGLRSAAAIKAAAIGAELFALILLAAILARRRLPMGRLALYAWSPLVIAEVAVSGHLDAFVLPILLAGLWAMERGHHGRAGLAIGYASLMKLYPVLALALLPRSGRIRGLLAAAAIAAMLYGIYGSVAGERVLGFLPDYARSGEDFNPGLRGFLQAGLAALPWTTIAGHARVIAMIVCSALLLAVVAWISRRPVLGSITAMSSGEDRGIVDALPDDPFRRSAALAVAFVLLLPTAMHPWYALWMVPLLCIRPLPAGLWLTSALPLSYLKYGAIDQVMPPWVTVVIWLPPLVLLAVTGHGRLRIARWAFRGRGG